MKIFDLKLDGIGERRLQWVAAAFIGLFAYAAFSKLMDYNAARRSMLVQVFSRETSLVLAWLVPAVELLVVALLLFVRTRVLGLWSATLLMLVFSVYLALANMGGLGRVPCACGGILGKMGYEVHLVFNLMFLALGAWGIWSSYRGALIHRSVDLREGRSGK